MATLVEHAAWLVDRFEAEEPYTDWKSFSHLETVLDEQCYRIPALEDDDPAALAADYDENDDDRPGWEPARKDAARPDAGEEDAGDDESSESASDGGKVTTEDAPGEDGREPADGSESVSDTAGEDAGEAPDAGGEDTGDTESTEPGSGDGSDGTTEAPPGDDGREPADGSESAHGSESVSESADDDAADVTGHAHQEADGEEAAQPRVELKDPADIASDSIQNPNDDEATYRRKNDEHHHGYKVNLAETCDTDDLMRLITDVQVDTNTTEDTEFLERTVGELAEKTDLSDVLNDGGYQGEATERTCEEAGVTQHFSGIKGRPPDADDVSLADAEFDGHELVACPQGHAPYVQDYDPETERHWGRMDKEICESCPFDEACFVDEKQDFFSYGFYDRDLEVARHRAKRNDPDMEEFLNQRAGAESMINEVMQTSGKRTKFTEKTPVETGAIATAIGINLKRAARALKPGETAESAAA